MWERQGSVWFETIKQQVPHFHLEYSREKFSFGRGKTGKKNKKEERSWVIDHICKSLNSTKKNGANLLTTSDRIVVENRKRSARHYRKTYLKRKENPEISKCEFSRRCFSGWKGIPSGAKEKYLPCPGVLQVGILARPYPSKAECFGWDHWVY